MASSSEAEAEDRPSGPDDPSRSTGTPTADTSGLAGETLNAMQTVQSFTLEAQQTRRYAEAVTASFRTAVRRIRMNAVLVAVAFVLVFGMLTLFLWAGAQSVSLATER